MTDFLLELLSEEIPARMQAGARNDLARLFAEELDELGITAEAIDVWSTPRRLALVARALLAFALSFDEIIVTTFTAGASVQTLPLWIFSNLARPNQAPIVNVVAAVLILLLLLIWGPIAATRNCIGILIIIALSMLGLEMLRRQTAAELPDVRPAASLQLPRHAAAAPAAYPAAVPSRFTIPPPPTFVRSTSFRSLPAGTSSGSRTPPPAVADALNLKR